MSKLLKDFLMFIREHGVVALAVGLAIGTQVTKLTDAIVEGFINPIVGFIVGNTDGLESATWEIFKGDSRELVIGWGLILSNIIKLLAVALVIYMLIKKLKLDKLDAKK